MRSSSRLSRIALLFFLLTALARGASAQAKIVGTVVDETGKIIRAATVTAERPVAVIRARRTQIVIASLVAPGRLVQRDVDSRLGVQPREALESAAGAHHAGSVLAQVVNTCAKRAGSA